ncbi:MAG TPA: DUF4399 domain-containing protein [Vineibacter sp.]|nr:DUF4399 domain-containing protein [Vineibacter sp.]
MRRRLALSTVAILAAAGVALAQLPRVASPSGAEVYFISPKDGEEISGPITVRFGLKGMGVAPAGVEMKNTGHHHLLVDAQLPPMGENIPNDDNYRHFGNGQTEVTITLPPGRHTLQLLFADHNHIPHDPPVMSRPITITVK